MVYVPAYIVRPDRRGKGIGKKLWNAMLERAEDRNIILDSVPAMESWYHDQGFQPSTTKVIFYHLVVSEDIKVTVLTKFDFQQLRYDTKTWQDVLEYDIQVYRGFNRERIIKTWYVGENVDSLVAYDAGKVVGYGSIHRKPNGTYGLRNVFADTEDALEAILRKLFEPVKVGSYVRFMLLDGKPLPSYLKHSTTANYFARRMFTKKMIEMDKDKIWLATSHAV